VQCKWNSTQSQTRLGLKLKSLEPDVLSKKKKKAHAQGSFLKNLDTTGLGIWIGRVYLLKNARPGKKTELAKVMAFK